LGRKHGTLDHGGTSPFCQRVRSVVISANQVSRWLQGAGYTANQVAGTLKDVFNQGAQDIVDILKPAYNWTIQGIVGEARCFVGRGVPAVPVLHHVGQSPTDTKPSFFLRR
jgi:hypothetical protein